MDARELGERPAFTEEEERIRAGRPPASALIELQFRAPEVPACPEHREAALPAAVPFDGDCGRIDCDCNNVESGITTREYRETCRARESELRIHCEITGELLGSCHPAASGPDAWP